MPNRSMYIPHKRITFSSGSQLVTKQSMKGECDIHNILRQYQKTGIITHVQNARPTYEDLPDNLDYQQALNTLNVAQEAFDGLPSAVRDRYGNDPSRLLAAINDPDQKDYLREVGILRPPEVPPAVPPSVPVPAPQEPA